MKTAKYSLKDICSVVEKANEFEKLAETGKKNFIWISYRGKDDFVTMDLFETDSYLDSYEDFVSRLMSEYNPEFAHALIYAKFEKEPTSRTMYSHYCDIDFFVELYRR